jgi:cyclophilin family peptidyl-prolyl cis-trans isomerase
VARGRIDNFRLDRDYTVIATIRDGLSVIDRVQEGDVIDRIEIVRRHSDRRRSK